MAEQTQKQHSSRSKEKTEETVTPPKSKAKSGEELKAEMDALLDDIEAVLEENAEDFVEHYIQKGGE